jgi:hypothetical protein
MQTLATALFVLVGLVNLLPVSGVLSAGRLEALYGLQLGEPNLLILMRHRAVLFGIVGALLPCSAFHVPLRPIGTAAGLVSMLSFVGLALLAGGYNTELQRVVVVDVVASVVLVAAALLSRFAAVGPPGP